MKITLDDLRLVYHGPHMGARQKLSISGSVTHAIP